MDNKELTAVNLTAVLPCMDTTPQHPSDDLADGQSYDAVDAANAERPNMTARLSLRMLGQNVTMMRCAWLDLLDELRDDSELAERIGRMLEQS